MVMSVFGVGKTELPCVEGVGAGITGECGWTQGLGLASGSCPGTGVGMRCPGRAQSPSVHLGQVGGAGGDLWCSCAEGWGPWAGLDGSISGFQRACGSC